MWICFLTAWAAPSEHTVEAVGRQEVVVDLPTFGRYAFEVRSEVGTALQLVDRMEGPGSRIGVVGERDGRIDAFFDRGQAKVVTLAPTDGRGNATVSVTPFVPVGSTPQLLPNEPVLTELEDRQSRGWWVDAKGPVAFEVAGRFLGDVRLWRDGTWLVGATPRCGAIDPVEGQPLQRCVLTATLEPGLYQLVAYGGPGDAWANEAPDSILSVRWDAPIVGVSGQRTGRIGPTGMEFFKVEGAADTAQLTLPEIAHASVALRPWSNDSVFDAPSGGGRITDESRTPEARATSSGSRTNVIAVQGTPGQRYTLTWFDTKPSPGTVSGSGEVLVTTMTTARPSDDLALTGLFYRSNVDGTVQLVKHAGVELAPGKRFRQRFNLLSTARLLVELDDATDVKFVVTEGKADLKLERYFTSPPKGYVSPKPRREEWADKHGAGTWVLTITPVEPGIVTLEGYRNSWSDLASSAVGSLAELPVRPGIATKLDLDPGASVQFVRFTPPGATSGYDVRSLPLDPRVPVALPLAPGERFVVPVQVDAPTRLHATLPNGERLPLEGFGAGGTELDVPAGSFAVTVHNATDAPVVAVFGAVVERPAPSALPPERLDALPDFPKLSFAKGYYTDLERSSTETLQLDVAKDGLYQLESTGLLATGGTLRSRIALNLGTGEQNGVGRNFRVARYLRSGAYQVTVGTRGQTTGHLGVVLKAAPVKDGGMLEDREVARATLEPDEGILYRFRVAERGNYHIVSSGQTQTFACRLEDSGGWPVTTPATTCDLRLTLEPGTYTLQSLPSSVQTRRRTVVERDLPGEGREGHGPFALTLGDAGFHTWVEPPGEGERPKDTWTFELPAATTVTVDPGDEMAGALMKDGETLARLSPSRTWSGPLEPGSYTVELRAARRGTGIPYRVRVSTSALTVGQRRVVSASSKVPLKIGTAGLVTVSSEGRSDVRARLRGPDGRVLAANDDRPDDWNFRISEWLQPGAWTLELESVSGSQTTVVVESPAETTGATLKPGGKPQVLAVGAGTVVHPLDLGATKEVVQVVASSDQNVGIGLEILTPDGWRSLGTAAGRSPALLGRRTPGHNARLRVWSLDGRSGEVRVELDTPNPRSPSGDSLVDGYTVGKGAWFALDGKNVSPGLFRVTGDRSGLLVCPRLGRPCHPAGGVVALNKNTVLFGTRMQLERADLAGEPVPVELDERPTSIETGLSGLSVLQVRAASEVALASFAQDSATALSEDGALAIGSGDAKVWGDGVGRVRGVALRQIREPWSREEPWSGEIPPRTAVVLPLAKDRKNLTVSLERGLVAQSGGQAVWADQDALRATLTGSGTLLVANPTDAPALALVHPAQAPEPALVAGQPHERFAARAGVEVREISAAEGQLRVANASVAYLRSDGVLLRGDALEIGPGGTAWITHGKGWYAAWSDAGGPGPWPASEGKAVKVAAGVTHLEADRPFALLVDVDGQRRVEWRPDGGSVDVLSRTGGTVKVRALGAGEVQPDIETQEVTAISEGLGPEVLLDAGGTRWFRFDLAQDGPVGIGVRAGADRVTATLVAPDGRVVTSGVVQRADLTAGSWYLRLSQPADAAPVRARPAVTGIDPPDDGPPDDVVRSYLEKAGFTAGGAR
ncbi:MAG: hypothetical protein R3F61_35875 [Myxococcota bacterium]